MDAQRQATANTLRTAVVDIDLQLYKGSVYKLRWRTPGGLDQAIPCYRDVKRVVDQTAWPTDLRDTAADLAERVDKYIATLESEDVTSASAQHSRMMSSFEALRDRVRVWPSGSPAAG